MYREMRLQARKLKDDEAFEILKNGLYGVMSTSDENGGPYGVPVSYAYLNNNIYFHCAKQGHKLDNIAANEKVSFCVVGDARNVPEEFTVKYESAIVYGRAAEVFGEEKRSGFTAIISKYSPQHIEEGLERMEKAFDKTAILRISIDHITGKAGK